MAKDECLVSNANSCTRACNENTKPNSMLILFISIVSYRVKLIVSKRSLHTCTQNRVYHAVKIEQIKIYHFKRLVCGQRNAPYVYGAFYFRLLLVFNFHVLRRSAQNWFDYRTELWLRCAARRTEIFPHMQNIIMSKLQVGMKLMHRDLYKYLWNYFGSKCSRKTKLTFVCCVCIWNVDCGQGNMSAIWWK